MKRNRKPRKVTPEMKRKIRELFESGKSSVKIGKKLNIHPTTVLDHLHKMGIDPNRGKKRVKITKEDEKEMVDLWKKGLSGYEIAKILKNNPSVSAVYCHLRKFVDTSRNGKYIPNKVTKEMQNKMIQLWEKGLPSSEIAKYLKISKNAVLENLKKCGVNTSKHANKPVTKGMREQIRRLYLQGLTCKQVSKKLGICDWTVRKYLRLMDIDPGKHPLAPGKVEKRGLKEKLIKLWNEGYSSWQIAEKLNLAKSSVLYNLRKFDIDTSRGYEIKLEILKQKYNKLQSILIKLFKNRGFKIVKITEYFGHDVDLLLKDSSGNLIPVEFKAEMSYYNNFEKGLIQLKSYIKKWEAPYGFLITTANRQKIRLPPNIKVIWSDELYKLFPENKKDLDFIRYKPVKVPISFKLS